MSSVSFTPHPLRQLMPAENERRQDLIRRHLTKAGLGDLATVRSDGRIAEEFDQQIAAQTFDALRGEALALMHLDNELGCEFIRVGYHDRLDGFERGSLDPATIGHASGRWNRMMASAPAIMAVWGITVPVLVEYADGSVRWEAWCDAIVAVDAGSPWQAKQIVKALIAVGSSADAPLAAWAHLIRTANTEFSSVFAPLLWAGGTAASWDRLGDFLPGYPTLKKLPGVHRAELLAALAEVSIVNRIIRLHRSEMTGNQVDPGEEW